MNASPGPSTAPPAITVAHVSKWFDSDEANGLNVLQDVSFDVAPGTITAIVGASGCGKSTLLNILSGLIAADRGAVHYGGVPGKHFDAWRQVAYMFQEDRLLPWRSALDNVCLGLEATRMRRDERRRLARDKLALVGLADFSGAFPHQLSGGMRSRVALARSLIAEPTVLLMDEPFSKLDPANRAQMHAEILRIQQLHGMTVVFVTHDAEEAVVLADRVIVLKPRPGRVNRVLPVPLPYPRTFTDSAFAVHVHAVRALI